jgi:preprotein translocase subunit SecF
MKKNKIIPFYQKRWIYFTISLVIMISGIIAMFANGVQLDIQFKGGAVLKYSYVGEVNTETASNIVDELLDRPVTAQTTSDFVSGKELLVLNIADNYGLDAGDQQKVDAALKEQFPDQAIALSESSVVQPFFGQKFLRNGILSLAISSLLVVLYVWIRFRKIGGLSAGIMALVALFHDVFVVFFACVIMKIPIGDSFIAVALTIIGYSINDTIVIYDRIRENERRLKKVPIETVTDLSITQSISRSINTNLAVLISISAVYFLAFSHNIDSIKNFALPMAIGAVSGCYSTICIAGPLWVMWKKRKSQKGGYIQKARKAES